MNKTIKKLILVVGQKQIEYTLGKDNEYLFLCCLNPTNEGDNKNRMLDIVFDITKCHPEYVIDMLLGKKGNIHAVIRSLYNNKDAVWVNKESVYAYMASLIIERHGKCYGIPCFSCPGSYLENNMNGCAYDIYGERHPMEESSKRKLGSHRYLNR